MNDENLLTTKDVALKLKISESTVRRWSDSGYLPCYRVGKANYRKFNSDEIKIIKDEIYSNKNKNNENHRQNTEIIKKDILPMPHPAHYLMHRYWGRKAHNVVNEYIANFTEEGDIVLDPFMGSGVTNIESSKLNRKSIGVDLNPMAIFIAENTLSNVDLDSFERHFNIIFNDLYEQFGSLYETKCPECNETCEALVYVWDKESIVKVRGKCKKHKIFIKDVEDFDIKKMKEFKKLFNNLDKSGKLNYPKDSIMKYVKRSGRESIDELFSERALIILSSLRDRIKKIEDVKVKNLLLLCFTSMLPNVSRMIPGDIDKGTYKSGWVISKFWTPTVHTERDIFSCFRLRFRAVLKGKLELEYLNSDLAKLYNMDSSNLNNIDSNSIDYIFTDPPYGESIAYFALSHFWNSWLDNKVDYNNEIIIDSNRKKGYNDYANRMKKVFEEMYRVLKPNHFMSFTFHNRDLNTWKSVLEGCLESGFELVGVVLQSQAVSSGTQGLNKKNTLTGDFVYNFKKIVSNNEKQVHEYKKNAEKFILNVIEKFLLNQNGATSSELYEYIIPVIAKNHAYCTNEGKVINIDKLIKNNFEYVEVINSNKKEIGSDYKWIVKK